MLRLVGAAGRPQEGEVVLRAVRDLVDVPLGVSDGRPDQLFPIPDGPVLLDTAVEPGPYDPTPRAAVGRITARIVSQRVAPSP